MALTICLKHTCHYEMRSSFRYHLTVNKYYCEYPQTCIYNVKTTQDKANTRSNWEVASHRLSSVIEAEPSPESFQQRGFAFVRGA